MENKNLPPVGTKVYHICYGWGWVKDIQQNQTHPIVAKFKGGLYTFTKEGFIITSDLNPTLSLTEYNLTEGGFTPISDWNKPKVGDIGYFWDKIGDIGFMHYGIIENIQEGKFFDTISDCVWDNFTKEIPEWYLKKIEELKAKL